MHEFALAQASNGTARQLAEECARQLGKRSDGLGFVYATAELAPDLKDIVEVLREQTGISNWTGTVGLGICATGTTYFAQPAIAALACTFTSDDYQLLPHIEHPRDLPEGSDDVPPALAVTHADPRNPRAMQMVRTLAAEHQTYLVGGLASAEDSMPQVSGGVAEGGMSGVLLDSQVQVAVGLTQGCSPIGPAHVVSRGESNILVTLDDTPAYEILCEDLGVADGVDPRPWLTNIHAAMPVPGSDTADYLVRNLMAIDPSNGLVVIGDEVTSGERIIFVRRDQEAAAKDLDRMLEDLKTRCRTPPKAGLYFSCLARGPNLFDDGDHELKAIRDTFGDIPIAGFFGNGEISNDRIYGYTGVLALFL